MVVTELILTPKDAISYLRGAKLFDAKLKRIEDSKRKYDIIFKVVNDDFLIKLSGKNVAAKLLLHHESIRMLEFTEHDTHIEFSLYSEHVDYNTIVFKINTPVSVQLKTFLTEHNFIFEENIKAVQTSYETSSGCDTSFIWIVFIIAFVIGSLYLLFTAIDFSTLVSSGVFRFIVYIAIFISLIVGIVSRFKS